MPQPVLAVVSVLGKDQKGVVAQFATYMADRGINIEDIEQGAKAWDQQGPARANGSS